MSEYELPAWSEPFVGDRRTGLDRLGPLGRLDREWAWGGSDGSGVIVAIIDSGVGRGHPAVADGLTRSVVVQLVDDGEPYVVEDPEAIDVVGRGTASAGIIHALLPAA